jgi:PAS domain S-box-containing protein
MSSVLVAGPAEKNSPFQHATNNEELAKLLSQDSNRVVVVPKKWPWLSDVDLAEHMARFSSLWLVGTEGFDAPTLRRFLNSGRVRGLISPGENFKPLAEKLEQELQKNSKIAAKNKISPEPSEKLHQANERLKALTQAMIGIQRANSIGEIEMVLNEALNPALELSWVRVAFDQQTAGLISPDDSVVEFPFTLKQTPLEGRILFGRKKPNKFAAGEKQFLREITDTASMALERLGKLDEAETLKQQWEATFDSIPHPLCITSEAHVILRTNRAFSQVLGKPFRELLGKNALQVFFPDQKPATLAPNSSLRLSKGDGLMKKEYEVICQTLGFELEGQNARLILFRDITEQLKIERRILESSKLAEIGTIASSIAHELNNPLGGMLSFLQLIRMDLEKTNPLYQDITAMEEGTLRCRDIIQNLLGFARQTGQHNLEPMDVRDAIERAVKLIELQSRSKGLSLKTRVGETPMMVKGEVNALSQSICNLLQNAIDSLVERKEREPAFQGEIEIIADTIEENVLITVRDNGLGIAPEHESQVFTPLFTTKGSESNAGLGLTVAYSIVRDHGGQLEIISQPNNGATAVITLPMLASDYTKQL